ncbi:MAG: hypothetical protein NWT08_02810 [Akkermansiaceae bacterium]|nr:hypothetical protein [Akkermansiaceae bacterium]MDP4646866.1 hypothetical protein [Akkermansiaceae bacterium]MDP4778942.1 hypothetical protein [Akkermansiaceae bacterium]MDP4845790.1 hypothetical protein [Akkermansiaceae bacterium]MDP4896336.1 hypothetical protein [Akkermansiaceae bacterium]
MVGTGKFDDEVRELRGLGLDTAFNLYSEAGAGFAEHIFKVFDQQRPDLYAAWKKKPADRLETIISSRGFRSAEED